MISTTNHISSEINTLRREVKTLRAGPGNSGKEKEVFVTKRKIASSPDATFQASTKLSPRSHSATKRESTAVSQTENSLGIFGNDVAFAKRQISSANSVSLPGIRINTTEIHHK